MNSPQYPSTSTFVGWPQAFTPEELDRIEQIGDALPQTQAGLIGGKLVEEGGKVRVTRTAWMDNDAQTKWIYDRIQQLAMAINTMSYRFDLTAYSERMQYSVYHGAEGGHYDWHVDQGHQLPNRRKLSMSLQLSDPSAYEGGTLEFLTGTRSQTAPRDRGALIAFPSYGLHRVTPVTLGTRKALVIWVTGPQFR